MRSSWDTMQILTCVWSRIRSTENNMTWNQQRYFVSWIYILHHCANCMINHPKIIINTHRLLLLLWSISTSPHRLQIGGRGSSVGRARDSWWGGPGFDFCCGRTLPTGWVGVYNTVTGWDRSHGLPTLSRMWQHVKLSDVSQRYSVVVDEDVKKPDKQTHTAHETPTLTLSFDDYPRETETLCRILERKEDIMFFLDV